MYLVPRLIGLGTYVMVLILFYLVIRESNVKSMSGFLKIYAVLLSVMAFFYVPARGADLYRIIPIMHTYAALSLEKLWDAMLGSSTPGAILYYFLVGQLGHDGFLPAITALIVYSVCFSILNDCVKRTGATVRDGAAVLLLFMSRGLMIAVISGIRTMLALSIIAWCIYQETVTHRSVLKNVVFYLIAASLHVMGQVCVILRILFFLIEKVKKARHRFWKVCIALVAFGVVVGYGENYIAALIRTGLSYYKGGRSGEGYFYIWEWVLSLGVILITVGLLRTLQKNRARNPENVIFGAGLTQFTTIVTILNIVAVFIEFNFFHRTSMLLSILDILLGIFVLKEAETERDKTQIRSALLLLSLVMLFVACARGDLCSLKFFE